MGAARASGSWCTRWGRRIGEHPSPQRPPVAAALAPRAARAAYGPGRDATPAAGAVQAAYGGRLRAGSRPRGATAGG